MSRYNQPLSGNDMPRFAGNASMFRLPVQEDLAGIDVAIIGVPLDLGTSNRTGTRYGPRAIRSERLESPLSVRIRLMKPMSSEH